MAERCRLLLEQWRAELALTARERSGLAPELQALEGQLQALERRLLRVAVFGRVGVGKSSLLNALLGEATFATDVAHGCTRRQQRARWPVAIPGLAAVELVDTPASTRSPPGPASAWRPGWPSAPTWCCWCSMAT